MIIQATRISTKSGPGALVAHVFNGDDNEEINVLRGSPDNVSSMFRTAKKDTYSVRHFIISPSVLAERNVCKDAVKALADEFGFHLDDAVIVEHKKKRATGGADRHWHVMVPERVPGQNVLSSKHMYQRHEKICRLLELKHGEKITKGRHNRAVVQALEKSGDLASVDKLMELTKGLPSQSAFTNSQFQSAKREGINLSQIKAALKDKSVVEIGHELAKLEKYGLQLVRGDDPQIVVLMKDEKSFGSVARHAGKTKNSLPANIIFASVEAAKQKISQEEARLQRVKEKENIHVQHIQKERDRSEENRATTTAADPTRKVSQGSGLDDRKTSREADSESNRRNRGSEKIRVPTFGDARADTSEKPGHNVQDRRAPRKDRVGSDFDRQAIGGNRSRDERVADNIQTYRCLIAQTQIEQKSGILLDNFSAELDMIADTPPIEREPMLADRVVAFMSMIKQAAQSFRDVLETGFRR